MKYYGSVINRMMESRHGAIVPEVGMGVTEYCWSDRHAYEIVEVIDARHIIIRKLSAKLVGDYYDQDYEYASDPNGRCLKLFYTAKGEWRERIGRSLGCNRFGLGSACEYRDPSF